MDMDEIKKLLNDTSTELKNALEQQKKEFTENGKCLKETSERIIKAEEALQKATDEAQGFEKRLTELEVKAKRMSPAAAAVRKTLGQQFIESDIFKACQSINRGNEEPFFEQKAISNDPASAGAVTQEWQNPAIFVDPNRATQVRDLVNHVPVTTDAVKIVREDVFTNNAAPQAGQLATKAESDITFSEQTYPVETQAHWLAASRQILADAARLRAYIDGRLLYGLDLLMDQQLLFGDGLGNNFTGIMVDTGVSDVGASAALSTGTEWIDHIRSAITQCQLFEYYNINGIILNPQDWQEIETAKGGDGHYIWVSVTQGGETRLWSVPVVVTNAMTQGSFVLGDWSMGSTLYDREMKSVRISEHNQDNFIKNAITVLAEERSAFAIELPKAFTKGTLTPSA